MVDILQLIRIFSINNKTVIDIGNDPSSNSGRGC